MYSKAKGSSFTSQVGFNFLPSITTKQSAKLYSRLELTYIEKCILPYKSFCLGSKTFKVKKQTNKKNRVRPFDSFSHHICILMAQIVQTFDSTIHQAPVVQTLDSTIHLAPVVQTLDSAIHRINHYPAEKY